MKASPFAPSDFAASSRPVSSPCVMSARPLALIAFTAPPDAAVEAKTLNVDRRNVSVKSASSSPNRVSGLSTPNRFIASVNASRGNGVGRSTPRMSFQTFLSIPSNSA